jgi:pimeloyl-ACP methyl ester carboxylesterase
MTRERRAALLASMREGLKQGIQGAVTDAAIYGRPWGFQLANIKVSTTVWQGTADHLIPPESVRAYAAIPGSIVHILDGHGHYSLALGETARIMAELVARTVEPGA